MPAAWSNPADALIEAIASWGSAHSLQSRRGVNRGGHEAWRAQNRLVHLIEECEQMLDEIAVGDPDADVEVHRAELVSAYAAVYGQSPNWTADGAPDLTPLRRLSGILRLHLRGSDVAGGDREVLEEALLEVLGELANADYMSETARAYLVTLVQRALGIVRDEKSTAASVRACSHEVAGALVSVAATTAVPGARKTWWRKQADTVATAVVSRAATAGADRMIEAGDQVAKMLTSGGN